MGVRSWVTARAGWLRATDLRLVAEIAVVAVLILAFVLIGNGVQEVDFDDRILLALRAAPDDPLGPRSFEAAVMHLSALGSGVVTGLLTLIAVMFLFLARRRAYAILVLACALGTLVFMELLKTLYERPRPTSVTHIDPPGGMSFPSGHSMIAAALYLTLAVMIARALPERRLRIFVIATGAFIAMLVGFTRLYLGVHYPTDVLGGWIVGLTWALTCGIVARRLAQRGTVSSTAGSDA
jgi:undecaprenyl-diphosphatase